MSPLPLPTIVSGARENVAVYRTLHAGAPRIRCHADLRHLTPITQDVLDGEAITATITHVRDICLTRSCEENAESGRRILRFLSYADVLDEYVVLRYLFAAAGISADLHRVLLVADHHRLNTLGEFGRYLAFYEWPTCAVLLSRASARYCKEVIRQFQPSLMVADLYTDERVLSPLLDELTWLVTFNKPRMQFTLRRTLRHVDLFRHRTIGIAAVSTDNDAVYRYDPKCFHFESLGGELTVTSLVNRLQPILRLRLGVYGTIRGRGEFRINEGPL